MEIDNNIILTVMGMVLLNQHAIMEAIAKDDKTGVLKNLPITENVIEYVKQITKP